MSKITLGQWSFTNTTLKVDHIIKKLSTSDIRKFIQNATTRHTLHHMPDGWYFQQDNDPKDKSKFISNFLKVKIAVPTSKSTFKSIEYMWDELDCEIYSNKDSYYEAFKHDE